MEQDIKLSHLVRILAVVIVMFALGLIMNGVAMSRDKLQAKYERETSIRISQAHEEYERRLAEVRETVAKNCVEKNKKNLEELNKYKKDLYELNKKYPTLKADLQEKENEVLRLEEKLKNKDILVEKLLQNAKKNESVNADNAANIQLADLERKLADLKEQINKKDLMINEKLNSNPKPLNVQQNIKKDPNLTNELSEADYFLTQLGKKELAKDR